MSAFSSGIGINSNSYVDDHRDWNSFSLSVISKLK